VGGVAFSWARMGCSICICRLWLAVAAVAQHSNIPVPCHCSPLPCPAAAGLDVSTLHQAMALIGERHIETEASGNVTLDTVRWVWAGWLADRLLTPPGQLGQRACQVLPPACGQVTPVLDRSLIAQMHTQPPHHLSFLPCLPCAG
jgi:hypothetical protein